MHLFRLTYGSPRFPVSICIPLPQSKLTIGPPTTIRKLRRSCSQRKPRIVTDIVTLLFFHQALISETYGEIIRRMRKAIFKVRYSWTRVTPRGVPSNQSLVEVIPSPVKTLWTCQEGSIFYARRWWVKLTAKSFNVCVRQNLRWDIRGLGSQERKTRKAKKQES